MFTLDWDAHPLAWGPRLIRWAFIDGCLVDWMTRIQGSHSRLPLLLCKVRWRNTDISCSTGQPTPERHAHSIDILFTNRTTFLLFVFLPLFVLLFLSPTTSNPTTLVFLL